ncbi:hypothetical protein K457DRAFT_142228 [Linnemannia elongata AG-77]|uniref:Uncharacterized protein n=1 Tax=Linnemannia elongata AG-77 TaxID=1314771 RepID=A0A197JGC3_9FUNG|nr:hypothetical protein K457DRAFT_142228 [Linnemannia elongata AG-77]
MFPPKKCADCLCKYISLCVSIRVCDTNSLLSLFFLYSTFFVEPTQSPSSSLPSLYIHQKYISFLFPASPLSPASRLFP